MRKIVFTKKNKRCNILFQNRLDLFFAKTLIQIIFQKRGESLNTLILIFCKETMISI